MTRECDVYYLMGSRVSSLAVTSASSLLYQLNVWIWGFALILPCRFGRAQSSCVRSILEKLSHTRSVDFPSVSNLDCSRTSRQYFSSSTDGDVFIRISIFKQHTEILAPKPGLRSTKPRVSTCWLGGWVGGLVMELFMCLSCWYSLSFLGNRSPLGPILDKLPNFWPFNHLIEVKKALLTSA